MANAAFVSLVKGFNAQIKTMNENDFKIFDEENPEFFISGVEYSESEDKLIFKTKEDPNELERLEELKRAE